MKRKTFLIMIACMISFLFIRAESAPGGSDDDGVVTYPDGGWGMDIGGGYQSLPDREVEGHDGELVDVSGEMVMPEGYRADYRDTPYGAMTQEGFVLFPKFKFQDVKRREKKEEEEKEELLREQIFYEATTRPNSAIWGVSSPRGDKKPPK